MKKTLCAAIAALAMTPALAATTYTAHVAWVAPSKFTDGTSITGAITYRVTSGTTSQMTSATTLDWPNTAAGQCFTVSAIVAGIESAQSNAACAGLAPNSPTTITVTVTTTVTVP